MVVPADEAPVEPAEPDGDGDEDGGDADAAGAGVAGAGGAAELPADPFVP